MSRLPVVVQAGGRNDFTHVCNHVSGLTFTKQAPGGDFVARARLDIDPARLPDLSVGDRVSVLNPRTGLPLWMGYIEDTGEHAGGFELAVTGGHTLATDERAPLVYVDQTLDSWQVERAATQANNINASTSDDPTNTYFEYGGQGLLMQFPSGQPLVTNSAIKMTYPFGDQQFGTIRFAKMAGLNSGDYASTLVTSGDSGIVFANLAPVGSVETAARWHANFAGPAGPVGQITEGIKRLSFQFFYEGAGTTINTDNVWMWWFEVQAFGRRMDRYGNLLTGDHATKIVEYGMFPAPDVNIYGVWARPVIEDLIGRLLPGVDAATAVVDIPDLDLGDPGTFTTGDVQRLMTQLVYRDPVHAASVLGDLALWEPELTWAIDAPLTLDGLHRFRAHMWDYDRPRYTITREHAFEPHVGKVDLANRMTVTWTSATGKRETYVATADVPELRDRVRDADPITLPEGIGRRRDAERIADAALDAMVNRPRSGSAMVYGPILDEHRGIVVEPCEIEVGFTALVADTGEILRVVEVEYDDEAQVAKVTLGELESTLEQRAQSARRFAALVPSGPR